MSRDRDDCPLTFGKHDEIAGRMDAYKAMFDHACMLEKRLRLLESPDCADKTIKDGKKNIKIGVGECRWDSATELTTRCELSLKLNSGHQFFTAGKTPFATAVLNPDGKTLYITIRADRFSASGGSGSE